MGAQMPKQYLPLAGKTVIEHSIAVFMQHPAITGVIVAITEGDPYWADIERNINAFNNSMNKPLLVAPGGQERCHSVLNALQALTKQADDTDWVLVHDAARPCLTHEDLEHLLSQLNDTEGGLLGLPMADTVKRCDNDKAVMETVDRSALWRALTPQMFRLRQLKQALQQALDDNALVTDDASAIELQGGKPLMVEGDPSNIKITHPADLALAELFISQQNKVLSQQNEAKK